VGSITQKDISWAWVERISQGVLFLVQMEDIIQQGHLSVLMVSMLSPNNLREKEVRNQGNVVC